MTVFRVFLASIFMAITAYTVVTIFSHGWDLISVFFGDIIEMGWPGQFNFDFMCFLLLSGLWVSWRHHFSGAGLLLGLLAFFGGALFLSAYLLWHSYKVKGNISELLLGEKRAA